MSAAEGASRSPLEQAQRALGLMGSRHATVMRLFRLATEWLDEKELIEAALDAIEQVLQAEASSVVMLDRHEGDLYFAAATGPVSDQLSLIRLDPHEGIVGWCMDAGRVVCVNNVHAEARWHSEISQQLGFDVRQLLAAPIRVGNRVIGCLEMVNKVGVGDTSFTPDDEVLIGDAAESLGILFALRSGKVKP